MKYWMLTGILVMSLGLVISGCSKESDTRKQADKVVEDVTGYTTYKQGERVKEKIKELEMKQLDRLKEAEAAADE